MLLCFILENSCSLERQFAELDQNTTAEERERIRIDFWDWIVHSHGIPTLNDDEIECSIHIFMMQKYLEQKFYSLALF